MLVDIQTNAAPSAAVHAYILFLLCLSLSLLFLFPLPFLISFFLLCSHLSISVLFQRLFFNFFTSTYFCFLLLFLSCTRLSLPFNLNCSSFLSSLLSSSSFPLLLSSRPLINTFDFHLSSIMSVREMDGIILMSFF